MWAQGLHRGSEYSQGLGSYSLLWVIHTSPGMWQGRVSMAGSCICYPVTVSWEVQSCCVRLILADTSLHFLPKRIAVLSLTRCILTACLGRILPAFAPGLVSRLAGVQRRSGRQIKVPWVGWKCYQKLYGLFIFDFFCVCSHTRIK